MSKVLIEEIYRNRIMIVHSKRFFPSSDFLKPVRANDRRITSGKNGNSRN